MTELPRSTRLQVQLVGTGKGVFGSIDDGRSSRSFASWLELFVLLREHAAAGPVGNSDPAAN